MSSPPSSVSPTPNDRKLFDDAVALFRESKWQEAKTAFNTLIGRFPGDPLLWNYRGSCWRELDNIPEAKADYNQAIKLFPKYRAAVYNLGVTLQDNKELDGEDGAIAVCSRFLQRHNPHDTTILHLRARCYDTKESYNLSIEDYKHILGLGQIVDVSVRVNTLTNFGIALKENCDYEEALKAFSSALDDVPKLRQNHQKVLAAIHYNRATCYKNMGLRTAGSDLNSALEYYDRAISDLVSASKNYPEEDFIDRKDCADQLAIIQKIIAGTPIPGAVSAHVHDQSSSPNSSQSFFPPASSSSAYQSLIGSSASASALVAPMIPAVPQSRSSASVVSASFAASGSVGVLAAGSGDPSSSASFQAPSSSSPSSATPASAAASQSSSASASSESESSMSPSSHSGTPRMGYP